MIKALCIVGISASLFLTACKEPGCTDPLAENYSDLAEENNGSCLYEARLVFYFDDARALYYNNLDGVYPPLKVLIDGNVAGEVNWWIQTYNEAPACDQILGTVNYVHSMSGKSDDVIVHITDGEGNSYDTRTINLNVGDCKAVLF